MALSPVSSQFADAQPNQAALPFSTDNQSRGQKRNIRDG
jgi:hypothetical protein